MSEPGFSGFVDFQDWCLVYCSAFDRRMRYCWVGGDAAQTGKFVLRRGRGDPAPTKRYGGKRGGGETSHGRGDVYGGVSISTMSGGSLTLCFCSKSGILLLNAIKCRAILTPLLLAFFKSNFALSHSSERRKFIARLTYKE